MGATKPTDKLDWANSAAPADVSYPAAAVEASGYLEGEELPHEEFNGILVRIDEWLEFLDRTFNINGDLSLDGSASQILRPIDPGPPFGSGFTIEGSLGGQLSTAYVDAVEQLACNFAHLRADGGQTGLITGRLLELGDNGFLNQTTDDGVEYRADLAHQGGGFSALDADEFLARELVSIGGRLNAVSGRDDLIDFPNTPTKLEYESLASADRFILQDVGTPIVLSTNNLEVLGQTVPSGLNQTTHIAQSNVVKLGAFIELETEGTGVLAPTSPSFGASHNVASVVDGGLASGPGSATYRLITINLVDAVDATLTLYADVYDDGPFDFDFEMPQVRARFVNTTQVDVALFFPGTGGPWPTGTAATKPNTVYNLHVIGV